MNEGSTTLNSHQTMSGEVADLLREAISKGSLPPGTRLVEAELARRYGVSRVPVREAINELAVEGLINKTPHYGAFVNVPSQKELEEITSLRVILEKFVVERVMSRWRPEWEESLLKIVEEMIDAERRMDYHKVTLLDYQFHEALWQMADHAVLYEVVAGLRSRINRLLYEATVVLQSNGSEVATESEPVQAAFHRNLISVIEGGDVKVAQDTIAHHIERSLGRILAARDRIAGAEARKRNAE